MPTIEQVIAAGHEENVPKVMALCSFLGCEPSELTLETYDHYGLSRYSLDSKEYAIGTDSEAQKAAENYVKDSIWAFNASFILNHCGLPLELEEAIQAFQGDKCESANDALLTLVEKCGSVENFTEEAIAADGRGHLLNPYDGEEYEEGEFFIYRLN